MKGKTWEQNCTKRLKSDIALAKKVMKNTKNYLTIYVSDVFVNHLLKHKSFVFIKGTICLADCKDKVRKTMHYCGGCRPVKIPLKRGEL